MTTKRRRFLPYRFADRSLRLQLVAIEVDGERLDVDQLYQAENRLLDLREFAHQKTPIQVHLASPGLDPQLAERVVPKQELDAPPVRVVAMATDTSGWYRTTTIMEPEQSGCNAVLELVPANSTGELTLEAVAMRTSDAALGSVHEFASRMGMRIASSQPIRVTVRDPSRVPGGALDVRWEDFTTSEHAERRKRSDRIFHLETTIDPPILWLNRANADLVSVLESKGTRGFKSTVRDLLNQAIALPVWYALVHAASLSVGRDESGEPIAPDGWKQGLLARIAPRMHPGVGKDTAYYRLLEDLLEIDERDTHSGESLPERLVLALQDELDLPVIAQRALRVLSTQ